MAEQRVDLISMADIARLAGQSRATVGNWKSRNPESFPPERGRGSRGPLYDRAEVTEWLEATNRLEKRSSEVVALWEVANGFRDVMATEDVVPLLMVLLALRSKAPEAWNRLRSDPPDLDSTLRHAVGEYLPDARSLIPPSNLPSRPLASTIAMISQLDASDMSAVADAALEQGAKALGARGGEFLAPQSVRRLMIAVAEPAGTIYNPATGAGQLLIDIATASDSKPVELIGQEINERIWAMSQMNLALHDVHAEIALGDVFMDDRYPQLRADRVMTVPPWGQRIPDADQLRDDPRWVWGEPGPGDGNAAWIQHCLAHLAERGRAVLVLPSGALFEGGRGGRIRQRVLKAGMLDAVIALPAGLFRSTSISSAVVVFRKGRPDVGGRPASTLMVDLSARAEALERGVSALSDRVIDEVQQIYSRWTRGEAPEIEYAAVATFDEIAANDFIIDPGRYLSLPVASVDRETAEVRWRELANRLEALSKASHEADAQLRLALGTSS